MNGIRSRNVWRANGKSIYGETFTRQQGILQRMILCKPGMGEVKCEKSWEASVAWSAWQRAAARSNRPCQEFV
jgi:hypothetical protein